MPNSASRSSFLQHRLLLFLLALPCLNLTLACGSSVPTPLPPALQTPTLDLTPWYSVYFTDPDNSGKAGLRGGPDKYLAQAIDQGRVSVDVAVQDLNLWSLRDALLHAYRRGLQVRLVIESDYMDGKEIRQLENAGIPVISDQRPGLMHDKFVVIDRRKVCTGSMNFTTTDGYQNNNNLICIRSPELAEVYTAEFNEMFEEQRFGERSTADGTPSSRLAIEGVSVEAYFAPEDAVLERLVELVRSAQTSIYFMAFSFTSDALAEALIERSQAGVKVAGVVESNQEAANFGGEFERLQKAGLDVRLDGNPQYMHHKVILIDEKIVITGSYNFTYNAENRNDENSLILFDPQIAALYLQEFERVWRVSDR